MDTSFLTAPKVELLFTLVPEVRKLFILALEWDEFVCLIFLSDMVAFVAKNLPHMCDTMLDGGG